MGSNDISPPHVYPHTVAVGASLCAFGGGLWTICYILLARESFRSKSYGMPLIALPGNLAWEIVYSIYVTEAPLERIVFISWLVINSFIVYGTIKHGKNEWAHSPSVARNLASCIFYMTLWWVLMHYGFAKWWVESGVRMKDGKSWFGVQGIDTTELGFWSASVPQVTLSLGSLGMLLSREHTGGLTWGIWWTRFLGSVVGFHAVYFWLWYMWPEAHYYFMNPVAIVMWSTSILADIVFAVFFARFRTTEVVLPDGRKIAGGNAQAQRSLRRDRHGKTV